MSFDVLGLTDTEEQTYRALVMRPSASAEELAEGLEGSPGAVHSALLNLERRGLAARRLDDADRFVPARPSVAVGALLAECQHQVRMAEVELHGLEEVYRTSTHERTPVDVVDVVLGEQAVRSRLEQLQRGAKREVLALVKAPVVALGSAANVAEDAAVAGGVSYRVVLDRQMLDEEPGLYDEARRMLALGERIRVSGAVPLKLVIVDRQMALVQIGASPQDGDVPQGEGALLVHRSGLLDALLALYDAVWADAFDLLPDPDAPGAGSAEPGGELDRQILTLLLAGMTDQAVAGNLGISVRTVQRHVRSLMERGRVETRMQLGWAAASHGWLEKRDGGLVT